MADITIVTVNWHSTVWIRRLLENLSRKSSGRNSLRLLILDNANGADSDLTDFDSTNLPCSIRTTDCRGLTGSKAHAFALNIAMDMIQTDFALIVDPDVHIFAPRWDSFCIESLKKWNAWAMGAPYPRWKVGKYHDFPSPVFFFFRRELVNHIPIDWRPYNDCPWCNGGVFVLRQFGRLGGLLNRRMFERSSVARCYAKLAESLIGTFSRDTGWRIAHAARKQKLPVILFEDILPQAVASLDTPADPVWTDLAGEFELFAIDNRPILVHRYGTGGRPWRTPKGNDESFWFACIDKAEAVIQGIKPPT